MKLILIEIFSFYLIGSQCFDLPQLPGVPSGVPNVPEIPEVPGLPELPGVPAPSEMSDLSAIPVSQLSGSPTELKQAADTCRSQINVSPDEAKATITQGTSTTTAGECFASCVKKQLGIIGADDNYNIEIIKDKLAPLKKSNAAMYEKAISAYQECSNAGANEKQYCKKARKLRECVKSKLQTVPI